MPEESDHGISALIILALLLGIAVGIIIGSALFLTR